MAVSDIRVQADALLSSGLSELLCSYGEMHLVGSYMMDLMVWRDLDIHLVPNSLERASFFELGRGIAELLRPHRMHYRDESQVRTDDLPSGFYWGVYLGDERAGAWKLDIWATDDEGLERVRSYCGSIMGRLSEERRRAILAIKAECWTHSQYRRAFGSADIYKAVLDHGVRDLAAFWRFLADREDLGVGPLEEG